ncbi:MAG: hypothetical protein LBK47_07220 [Prevotellaceae bacterium]|nr:hypothetical protein [Prevotellaceae bacterium]
MKKQLLLSRLLLMGTLLSTQAWAMEPIVYITNTNVDLKNRFIYGELVYDAPDQCARYELRFKTKTFRSGIFMDSARVKFGTAGSVLLSNTDRYTLANDSAITDVQASGLKLKVHLPLGVLPTDSVALTVEVYKKADECLGCGVGGSNLFFSNKNIGADCPYPGKDNNLTLLACNKAASGSGSRWEAYVKDVRDCNKYRLVFMPDNRWWMAQNLRYGGSSSDSIGSCATGVSCKLARLYTWYEAVTAIPRSTPMSSVELPSTTLGPQGVCSAGWHIPTQTEWEQLGLGVDPFGWNEGFTKQLAASEAGTASSWYAPANNMQLRDALDRYGFDWMAVPIEAANGINNGSLKRGAFWAASHVGSMYSISANRIALAEDGSTWAADATKIDNAKGLKTDMLPVRCVKGESSVSPTPKEIPAPVLMAVDSVCSGTAISTSLGFTKYQFVVDGVEQPEQTSANIVLTSTVREQKTLKVRAADYYGRWSVYSSEVSVLVLSPFSAGAISSTGQAAACDFTEIPSTAPASGGGSVVTYRWKSGANIIESNTATYTPAIEGVYTREARDGMCQTTFVASDGSWTASISGGVAVSQSTTNVTYNVCPNTTRELVLAEATGGSGAISYQWQYGGTADANYADIQGATSPNYTPEATNHAAVTYYYYYRRLATSCGKQSVSGYHRVYVSNITAPAAASIAECSVSQKTLSPAAASGGFGTDYTYQWQVSTNGTAWTDIEAETGAAYTTPAQAGLNYYRRNITTTLSSASCALQGAPTTVDMRGVPKETTTSTNANICPNTTHTINLPAATGGTTYTYRWQYAGTNNSDTAYKTIPDSDVEDYTPPATNHGITNSYLLPYCYRRMASCDGGLTWSNPTPAQRITALAVTAPAATSVIRCTAAAITLSPAAASNGFGTGYTYQWQSSADNSTWENLVGITSATYNFTPAAGVMYYRRNVTSTVSSNFCSTNGGVTMVTVGTPVQNTDNVTYPVCPNTTRELSLPAPTGGITYLYQWQSGGTTDTSYTNIADATDATYTPPAANHTGTNTYYYYRRLSSCDGGANYGSPSGYHRIYSKSVVAPSVVVDICAGGTALLTPSAPADGFGEGYTYQWQDSANNSAWTDIAGATDDTYQTAPGGVMYYRRNVISSVVGLGSCTSNGATITLAVNNAPSISASTSSWTPEFEFCGTLNAGALTLTATPSTSATIDWYAQPTGGAPLAVGVNTYTNAAILATTTFYAEARNPNGGCVSTARKLVATATKAVSTSMVVASINPISINGKLALQAMGGSGVAPYTYAWGDGSANYSDNDIVQTVASIVTASGTAAQNITTLATYYLKVKDAVGCESPQVALNTFQLPAIPADAVFCANCGYSGNTGVDLWYAMENSARGSFACYYPPDNETLVVPDGRMSSAIVVANCGLLNNFATCSAKGTGWYVPSYKEVQNIWIPAGFSTFECVAAGIRCGYASSSKYAKNNGGCGWYYVSSPTSLQSQFCGWVQQNMHNLRCTWRP